MGKPVAWLIGGSRQLGTALVDTLGDSYHVINISRTPGTAPTHYALDLADLAVLKEKLPDLKARHFPRALIFCQRYRPAAEVDIRAALNIEILSTQSILEEILQTPDHPPVSIVIISSITGILISPQLPFWYHWLKVSQHHLVKYFSTQSHLGTFTINGLAPGSFLKAPLETYPVAYQEKFHAIGAQSPQKKCATTQNIADTVKYLISDKASYINGQVLNLDGGASHILQEALTPGYYA